MNTRSFAVVTGVALVLWGGASGSAQAQFASAHSVGGLDNQLAVGAVAGPGVIGDACAFSRVPGSGTNNLQSGTERLAGGPAIPFVQLEECPFVVPRAALRPIRVDGVGVTRNKLPPRTVTVQSQTNGLTVSATGTGQWSSVGGGNAALRAVADVVATAPPPPLEAGRAAGLAEDPFFLPPGTYPYAPVIFELLLAASGPRSLAMLGFDASNSMAASGLFWTLGLSWNSLGNLEIEFRSDPLLGLSDPVVEANLRGALDFSTPGTVQLTSPYTLFSSQFSASETFQHSEAVRGLAQVNVVPEPAGLLLFGTGLAGVVAVKRRRRTRTA